MQSLQRLENEIVLGLCSSLGLVAPSGLVNGIINSASELFPSVGVSLCALELYLFHSKLKRSPWEGALISMYLERV